jgi:hypothetical protein
VSTPSTPANPMRSLCPRVKSAATSCTPLQGAHCSPNTNKCTNGSRSTKNKEGASSNAAAGTEAGVEAAGDAINHVPAARTADGTTANPGPPSLKSRKNRLLPPPQKTSPARILSGFGHRGHPASPDRRIAVRRRIPPRTSRSHPGRRDRWQTKP